MNQQEFAQRIVEWKKEFIEDVVDHYSRGNRERGNQGYARWRERFIRFLESHAPGEAKRFETTTSHLVIVETISSRAIDEFMGGPGRACLGFLDDLEDTAQKGKLIDFQEQNHTAQPKPQHTNQYVDPTRITEIKSLTSSAFDHRKLIRLCEELNICYKSECYLAVVMILRSILDHVPPIFGCKNFGEVANSYKTGMKSFKDSMQHPENSSRKIANAHLHEQIRKSETLPNKTQVNFTNDLDVLLAETVRVLR